MLDRCLRGAVHGTGELENVAHSCRGYKFQAPGTYFPLREPGITILIMGLLLAIFLGSCGAAIVTEHTYGDDVFAPVGATTITTEDVPDGVDVFAPQPAVRMERAPARITTDDVDDDVDVFAPLPADDVPDCVSSREGKFAA